MRQLALMVLFSTTQRQFAMGLIADPEKELTCVVCTQMSEFEVL